MNDNRQAAPQTVGVVSLGCDKNRVDTEQMLAVLEDLGYKLTQDPAQADILIVNTCGFIREAQQESINTVLEMAQYKKTGRCKVLLMTGCLSQRFGKEMATDLPEVDGFIGVNSYADLPRILTDLLAGKRVVGWRAAPWQSRRRRRTTPPHLAYVRIADGCSNGCSYCAIPAIRGRYLSRPMEDVVQECAHLVLSGVRELVLVAQDTTRYGADLAGGACLTVLLERICALPGDFWVRVLYAYPEMVDDALLQTIHRLSKVCNYLDVPIQHIDDGVLRAMRRSSTAAQIRDLVARVRALPGDFALRTTLLVGFPGETRQQFDTLCDFIKENPFDHLGCFAYSREEGTRAAKLSGQIPRTEKQARQREVMEIQRDVAGELAEKWVGKTVDVLVEGYDMDTFMYVGRSRYHAPEVDGNVYFFSTEERAPGDVARVCVEQIDDYDWMGREVPAVRE